MKKIEELSQIWTKAVNKIAKEIMKKMGDKTLKINTLQHFKLSMVKAHFEKQLGYRVTYGQTISMLCEKYEEELKNGNK